jgi:hypothetical protein
MHAEQHERGTELVPHGHAKHGATLDAHQWSRDLERVILFGERLHDRARSRIRERKPSALARDEVKGQRVAAQRAGREAIVVGEDAFRQRAIDGCCRRLRQSGSDAEKQKAGDWTQSWTAFGV